MKKLFATIALALSLTGVGATAHAAGSALTFEDGTTDFGAKYGAAAKGSTFSDSYTFSYSSAFDVSSAVISIALTSTNSTTGQTVVTSGVTISDFTLTNTTTGQVYHSTSSVGGGVQYFTIAASSLTSGNYALTVSGSVIGTSGGSYGGNISISAVPEASTTAMMLGGLALVGFVAYRRRGQKTTTLRFNHGMAAA